MDGPGRGHHDGPAPRVGHKLHAVAVRKLKAAKVMQGHIDVERFAVAHAAHADVGNAVHGQGVVQQVFPAGRASELIAGGLAQQAVGGHGHAEGLH